MPYITQERRNFLNEGRGWSEAATAGELNYEITKLVRDYVAIKQSGYQAINDALGALEGAKLEFYRRVVVPYENQKAHDNGDVYGE